MGDEPLMYSLIDMEGIVIIDPGNPPYLFTLDMVDINRFKAITRKYKVFRHHTDSEVEIDRLSILIMDGEGFSILKGYESLRAKLKGGILGSALYSRVVGGKPLNLKRSRQMKVCFKPAGELWRIIYSDVGPIIIRLGDVRGFIDMVRSVGCRVKIDDGCRDKLLKYNYLVERYGFNPDIYVKFFDGCILKIFGERAVEVSLGIYMRSNVNILPPELEVGLRRFVEVNPGENLITIHLYR